jgi:anthranilate synthase component 1
MIYPSLQKYLEHAGQGRRLPLRKRIPADLETPVSAFLKLRAGSTGKDSTAGASFLLESVEQGIQVGRYSFIGVNPHTTMCLRGDVVEITRSGESSSHGLEGRDPLSFVRDEIARATGIEDPGIPGPFAGAVGYMSYDVAQHFEKLPAHSNGGLDVPDFCFVVPRTLVIFDHVKCEIEIVALPPGGDPEGAYGAATREIESLLAALQAPLQLNGNGAVGRAAAAPESNMTREEFEDMVRAAKEHILAGDAFQIVLSQRLSAPTEAPPFQIYRALRILNPSPYMFFFDFDGFQMIGSSPEMLVKLEGDVASLSPIAGTRPRGETPAHDEELGEELLADEKERAEHVMLVDLGRNDLGRVCETGTVETTSLMHVERYSHVMHIVSRVTGRLREGLDGFDLVRASFPAGTVSGAPKIRAMELIAGFERDKRGPYAGAVGYFGRGGDMDMCITIRTIIMKGGRYFVQGGAGIVADSDPATEYHETLAKIRALVRAVEIAEEGL